MTDSPIDVVYFWCDGSDPAFSSRKERAFAESGLSDPLANHASGYSQRGELALSVSSVRRFMPWVRNIFVVTDRQNPLIDGVTLLDHSDILDGASIPCFNPYALEASVWKIPGLSEHFIFANDDTYVRKPVAPEFFFRNGIPVTRFRKCERDEGCVYQHALDYSYAAFNARFGTSYETVFPHHNMDGCLLSTACRCYHEFADDCERMCGERFRTRNSIHRVVWGLYDMTFNGGGSETIDPAVSHPVSMYLTNTDRDVEAKVAERDPVLFCVNDTRFSSDDDRDRSVESVRTILRDAFQPSVKTT